MYSAPQIVHADLISLGVGNVAWFLMMCIIVPVGYLTPRSFAILSTEREYGGGGGGDLINRIERIILVWSPSCFHELSVRS